MVPLEAQGYEDVSAGRVTTFLPGFSAALARTLGAAACKLLLPYRPDHEASAARQDDVVRAALAACHEQGLPLILEPILYVLPGEAPEAFATAFPSLVVTAAGRLQALGPDLLKVQFPRDDRGDEADWCTQLDAACGTTPWVLLGGGGSPEVFARDLRIACAAGASGFIAGRTLWTGVIGDDAEAETWLRRVGVPLLHSLRDIAQSGRPWRDRVPPASAAAARLVRVVRRDAYQPMRWRLRPSSWRARASSTPGRSETSGTPTCQNAPPSVQASGAVRSAIT